MGGLSGWLRTTTTVRNCPLRPALRNLYLKGADPPSLLDAWPGPPTLEHSFRFLNPFEFPRPFEAFEGGSFLMPLCSETPSNTVFCSGRRRSRRSRFWPF